MDEHVNLKDKTIEQIFTLIWKNIFYEVETNQTKDNNPMRKVIINNVSGFARSGEITAIMGPSGCGKTSLLNYLTDRIAFPPNSSKGGGVYLNSEPVTVNKISSVSSYVMQDDVLLHVLTPRETLMFVSKLRKIIPEAEHTKLVDDLMEELKLTKCQNTRIGNEMVKGVSGGERKRVSIGVEIISNPSILFLDEPTSGLDSQTSLIVIDFLKELAQKRNKAIIFTIHQPSSNIFSHLDRLIILNKGQEVYQGTPLGVYEYFTSCGKPLEDKANPSDAFMHIMEEQNIKIEREKSDEKTLMQHYIDKKLGNQVDEELKKLESSQLKNNLKNKSESSTGFCNELGVLCGRAWTNLIRNPNILKLRVIMVLIFSFICCSIFYNMKNDYAGIYNKMGFFFFFTVNNFMTIIFGAVLAFPLERGVFLREYSGKMYSVLPYYISKNMIETPPTLISTFLYGIIVYYICGLRGDDVRYFFTFLCIYVCLGFHAQSIGLCYGTAFSSVQTALIIVNFSVLPIFLFSGFLINQENMPPYLAWIRFFSPFRYAIEAGTRNEFDENPLIPENFNPVNQFNFDIGIWNCVIIMVAWSVFLRILGFIFLKILVRKLG